MLDHLSDALIDAAMPGHESWMNEEEWLLLRNRIWISWALWFVCIAAMAACMAGFGDLPAHEIMFGSFVVFLVTRILRAYRRPKTSAWEVRRHWYTFSYKIVPLTGILVFLWWGAPVPLGGWVAFGMTLYLLAQVQVKDDIIILRAIPRIIQILRQRS